MTSLPIVISLKWHNSTAVPVPKPWAQLPISSSIMTTLKLRANATKSDYVYWLPTPNIHWFDWKPSLHSCLPFPPFFKYLLHELIEKMTADCLHPTFINSSWKLLSYAIYHSLLLKILASWIHWEAIMINPRRMHEMDNSSLRLSVYVCQSVWIVHFRFLWSTVVIFGHSEYEIYICERKSCVLQAWLLKVCEKAEGFAPQCLIIQVNDMQCE